MTFAVYELSLKPKAKCVHTEPYHFYVGSTHESPSHPASARIEEHKVGYNSKVLASGYRIVSSRVVRTGFRTRDDAEGEEGRHAAMLREGGRRVWCNK